MKLLLSLLIFSEVWVVVGELVELLDEFIKDVLLSIKGVKVFKELLSDGTGSNVGLLSVHANVPEDLLHLPLVVCNKILPKLDDNGLEVIVYVVTIWQLGNGDNACVIHKSVSHD